VLPDSGEDMNPAMNRFTFGILIVIVAVWMTTGCGSSKKKGAPASPHVFLIVIETLRTDRLGVYGREPSITPNIDAFAKRSILYQNAYSASSWTKTAVASMLTGLNPYRHSVFEESLKHGTLPPSATTIAEVLKNRGYYTHAISLNPHVSKKAGYGQGFRGFKHQDSWVKDTTEWGTDDAIEHLEKADMSKPQHLYIHYLDPHDPWPNRKGRCDSFLAGRKTNDARVRNGRPFDLSGERKIKGGLNSGNLPVAAPMAGDDLMYLEALYDCEVSGVDKAVGRLLTYLEKEGWLDHALVIVTADHGEEFLEHGYLRHGYQLYGETVHVPLMIFGDGLKPGLRKEVVSTMEIPATIYHHLGFKKIKPSLDQRILPGFGSISKRRGAIFGATLFRKQNRAYLIQNNQKVIYDFKEKQCQMFDLEEDPMEKKPAICRASQKGKTLLDELTSIQREAKKHALNSSLESKEMTKSISASEKEQLEALGYIVD
jgi:arylsulfatase A-like enzyme